MNQCLSHSQVLYIGGMSPRADENSFDANACELLGVYPTMVLSENCLTTRAGLCELGGNKRAVDTCLGGKGWKVTPPPGGPPLR